ncbi:hypothetical protein CC86DRAFT_402812 [Ophiobolus disseminans]|uniref:Uncharacterized protein n=1 Tax=Ophiobolus disseminans TaxID=1469910 RepID=A0A6A7AC19_9PLEO|nr:hypothetical protein CC86DRAFT_402812 [Ophiobolus disseminans]
MFCIDSIAGGRSSQDTIGIEAEIGFEVVPQQAQDAGDTPMLDANFKDGEVAQIGPDVASSIVQPVVTLDALSALILASQLSEAAAKHPPPELASSPLSSVGSSFGSSSSASRRSSAKSSSPPVAAAAALSTASKDAPLGSGRVTLVGSNGAIVTAPTPASLSNEKHKLFVPAAHKLANNAPAAPLSRVENNVAASSSTPKTLSKHTIATASASASRKLSKFGVPAPGFSQKIHLNGRKLGEETFERHPTDPNKIIARYRVKKSDNTYYTQVNDLHEIDTAKTPKETPKSIMEPHMDHYKVPRRVRANKRNGGQPILFIEDPKTGVWTRAAGDHGPALRWKPCILFRRLDSETGEYLQPYVNVDRLEDVNPNNKEWAYAYNKWLDQIKRRRDSTYKQVILKHHWSHAERSALYSAINAFIARSGLHSFDSGTGTSPADLHAMTAAVNATGHRDRSIDAVRGQIASSHAKKNKAIWELRARAQAMRLRIAGGEKVSRKEKYPKEAISRAHFPGGKGIPEAPLPVAKMEREEHGKVVPWYRASPPDAAALLEVKGRGMRPNRAEREGGWEVEEAEEDWMDTDDEGSFVAVKDRESDWEDVGDDDSSSCASPSASGAATPSRRDDRSPDPVTPVVATRQGKRKRVLCDDGEAHMCSPRPIKKARGMAR